MLDFDTSVIGLIRGYIEDRIDDLEKWVMKQPPYAGAAMFTAMLVFGVMAFFLSVRAILWILFYFGGGAVFVLLILLGLAWVYYKIYSIIKELKDDDDDYDTYA